MKKLATSLIVLLVLSACSTGPTQEQIQGTVIAQVTSLAKQATPYPTYTPLPTYTPYPTYTPIPKPTNTPKPTATTVPETGTSSKPHVLGQPASLVYDDRLEFDVTILDVQRGADAWRTIVRANQFNDPAPDGMEYVVVKVGVEYTGKDEGPFQIDKSDWAVATKGRVIGYFNAPTICCLANEFEDITLLPGGHAEGVMAWPVAIGDENPMLVIGQGSDGTGGIYFALQE